MKNVIRNVPHDGQSSLLTEITRRIVTAIDPDRIILFGSRARGDAGSESDYDLLVIKSTDDRTLQLEKAAYRAMVGMLASVDILVETPERLERLRDAPALVFGDAMREGVAIYERPTGRSA
jgi:predicted nucleotidyltransferase